jgi:glycosyltransferase involved in cell wall biosynthesis
MRIGLFMEIWPNTGGGFQQALSMTEALMRRNVTHHETIVFTPYEQTRQFLLREGINAILFKYRFVRLIDRWSGTVVGNAIIRRLRRIGFHRLGRHLDAMLDDHGVDLAVLTGISESAVRIGNHPFMVTIWDLNHRDYPEFPEAYANRVFERREWVLQATLPRAHAVIADSAFGARRIASLYHVDPSRIIELPYLPSLAVRRHAEGQGSATVEDVRHKYDLPSRYVFYPAFFSYHKNHLYLLEGLKELERHHGIILDAIFCGGGDPGDQEQVERQVEALGLTKRVKFLGLVPDAEIPALYQGALALVMPAYFGPTNLPPLEAVTVGCPVIYSDLPEFREQMGDAALYCDLTDVSSLANHLSTLIQDSAALERLRKAGAQLAVEIGKIDYGQRLGPVIDHYTYTSRRWSWPDKR